MLTELRPGVLLITLYGYNDGEIGEPIDNAMDAMIASVGSVCVFMDTREQSGISGVERERATAWAKQQGDKYRGHLLFKSRIVEMALALGNLVLGGKTAGYSKVQDFEHAIVKEVPWFVELPIFRVKVRAASR